MKKVRVFIGVNLFCVGTLLCQPLYISKEAIINKVPVVQKTIRRHQYMVATLSALGYMHQLSLIAAGLEYFLSDSTQYSKNKQNVKQEEKRETPGFFAELTKDTKELFGTRQGWMRIGQAGVSLVAQIGAFCLFQKVADTIYHPDTLRWYIRTGIPYERTISAIESLARKLATGQMSERQKIYYEKMLHQSCHQLIQYAQDACAYMVYKKAQLPDTQKILAKNMIRHLLRYHNDIFSTVFTLLEDTDPSFIDLIDLVKEYKEELRYHYKLFASIEGENVQEELDMSPERDLFS